MVIKLLVYQIMGKESWQIGRSGEEMAAEYLARAGYKIIERNFHSQQGELDLIAEEGEFLVFVEVKNYSCKSFGSPLGAVRRNKKESIIHAARTYIYKKNISGRYCRFDVLAIYRRPDGSRAFDLIRDAFRC